MDDQEIQRHWKEILNTLNDGLVIIGPDGTIRLVNDALTMITGYTRREILGRPCSIFNCDVCEMARTEGKGKWCLLFDVGHADRKRCIITRRDGSYVSVYKKAALLKDERGNVLGALETLTDISELEKSEQKIEELSRMLDGEKGFHGLIGKSPAMQRVFHITEKAAQSDAPVLIYGASGTGKELLARAVHDLGRRKDGPYIQLNCAALNEALLESELFGHVRGAFTGAYRHRKGRFEAAHGGDIFLDEIGDVPLSIQVKLLRVLETKQLERVGDHEPISVDVRIIAATNRNLPDMVAQKLFREDFFFRINVIPIHLPNLCERREDIPLLTDHFVQKLRRRTGKDIAGLTPEAMKLFMQYSWPGNVRELKSALEYAFVIAGNGPIRPEHLPGQLCSVIPASTDVTRNRHESDEEKAALLEALRRAKGNQSQAARILGVNRVTVWNRIRKYGVDIKKVIHADEHVLRGDKSPWYPQA